MLNTDKGKIGPAEACSLCFPLYSVTLYRKDTVTEGDWLHIVYLAHPYNIQREKKIKQKPPRNCKSFINFPSTQNAHPFQLQLLLHCLSVAYSRIQTQHPMFCSPHLHIFPFTFLTCDLNPARSEMPCSCTVTIPLTPRSGGERIEEVKVRRLIG